MPRTMVAPENHRTLGPAERRAERPGETNYHSSEYAETLFRDPTTFAEGLARLERHYRDEAARLQAEAADARKAAQECRQWRHNLADE